jgi:DNA-binding MarR family transcriptional regulator
MNVVARITESANRELKNLGLNLLAGKVLMCLYLCESAAVGDLADDADIDQSTVSHMLRRLQNEGLVSRVRMESDNRSVMVTLTAEGRTVAAQCMKTLQHHDKLLVKTLDGATEEHLKRVLLELIDNTSCFEERARLLAVRQGKGKAMADRFLLG